MPISLQQAIGLVKDQTSISLAKVNCSSNLQVLVLKATTHDDLPIDDQNIHEILNLISSNKTYAELCASAIGRRITRTRNRVVALKSLMLVLRILQDGDPYFPREVVHATKKGNRLINLSSFLDGSSSGSWDYIAFVHTFGLYVNERLECFLTGKLQKRCNYNETKGPKRFKKKTNDYIRDMKPAMLIDRIAYWQRLLKRAIATKPTGSAKENQLVKDVVYMVVRESFDLYKDVSDGLALILDSFSSLKEDLRFKALEICVNAEKQFKELQEFYSACKALGIGRRSEYPSVEIISQELIETLEESLEDKPSSPSEFLDTELSSTPYQSYEEKSEFSGFELKTHSGESEKKLQQGESFKSCESGSTPSLDVTKSTTDILSLHDSPANEEQKECQEANKEQKECQEENEEQKECQEENEEQKECQEANEVQKEYQMANEEQKEYQESTEEQKEYQETNQDVFESNLVNESPLSTPNLTRGNSLSDDSELKQPQTPNKQTDNSSNTQSEDSDLEQAKTPTTQSNISSNTLDASTTTKTPPMNHYNQSLKDLHDFRAACYNVTFPKSKPFLANRESQATKSSNWTYNATTNEPFSPRSRVHRENSFIQDMITGNVSNEMVYQLMFMQQQQLWLQNNC